MDAETLVRGPAARVRATSYVTRSARDQLELLIFSYAGQTDYAVHLPGGGVEPGERPDEAALREAIEETGVAGRLAIRGLVGVQQGTYDSGEPCISLYFHLHTDDTRTDWTHVMQGEPGVWDTGMTVNSRFVPLEMARQLLGASRYRQEEFISFLAGAHLTWIQV